MKNESEIYMIQNHIYFDVLNNDYKNEFLKNQTFNKYHYSDKIKEVCNKY